MDISFIVVMYLVFIALYGTVLNSISLKQGSKLAVVKDFGHTPTVSILISAFNEGSAVYDTIKSIRASKYPPHLVEIVATDDCSRDDTFKWLQKAAEDFPGVLARKNVKNMGKAPTMAHAAQFTTGRYILCTDADTVFHEDAISELMACFTDPRVGGVGGSIGIVNVNESILTQMQTFFYNVAYWLCKPMENVIHATQCLGGPLVAFPRELYIEIADEVINRNFFGEPLHNGEDRFITQCVLLRGLRTYTNLHAKCYVGTPVKWDNYFKQQLRWRRSAMLQWIYTTLNMRRYLRDAGVAATIASVVPILSCVVWGVFLVWLCQCGTILQAMLTLFMMKMMSVPLQVVIYNHFARKFEPTQTVNDPIMVGFFMSVWFIVSIFVVLPWSLLTLDDGGWVTRQDGLTGNA